MKALRGKREDSEQKSHTALSLFLLATSILGIATTINTATCRQKTAVAEGSQTRWGGSTWTWNLLMEIII